MRLSPRCHSGAGRNPGNGGGGVNDCRILQRPDCVNCPNQSVHPSGLTRCGYPLAVIPAQAGIQETGAAGSMIAGFYRGRIV